MVDIANYGLYTIQCKFRDSTGQERFPALPFAGYLHVPSARRVPSGITQWTLERPPVFENHHFYWLFIEAAEDGQYYIVNRRSGLCLRVPSKDGAQQLTHDYYAPDHDAEFRFVLEPVPDRQSSCRILCYSSGYPLLVAYAKPDNGLKISTDPDAVPETMANLGLAEFELTQVGMTEFNPAVAEEPGEEPGTIRRQLPKLTSLDQDLPRSFPDRLDALVVEQEVLPFFAIKDPGLAPYRQVEASPFYTLRHWQQWHKVIDHQFDGQTERETTETVAVGMTQLDASSFKSTFNWSVETTAQAGFEAGPWSASLQITAKIASEIEKTTQQSTEHRIDRTQTNEVTYPSLHFPYRIVTWVPADVYELCRTNEQRPINTWTVAREGEDVTNIFPEKIPKTPVRIPAARRAAQLTNSGSLPPLTRPPLV